MSNKLFALSLAAAAALSTSLAAHAESEPAVPPDDFSGAYVIEVMPVAGATHAAQCMTINPSQRDYGVRVQNWGKGGLCGMGSLAANVAAKHTVWDVTKITHVDGRHAYTFRNRATGKCLIRGHNGNDVQPTTHLWGPSNAYCGFKSAEAAIDNGQGTWLFDEVPFSGGLAAANLRTTRFAYLSFATMAAGSLPNGAAMMHVDRLFHFTPVP